MHRSFPACASCTEPQFAYLRLPGFGEPPGTGSESLAPGFETYDAFLAARYEAEGFLVNTADTDTAAEAVKRIRRDPSLYLKPVFLLRSRASLPPICANGQVRSLDQAQSLLAELRRDARGHGQLPPASESGKCYGNGDRHSHPCGVIYRQDGVSPLLDFTGPRCEIASKQQLAEAQQKRDYRRIADELAQLHQQCLQLLMREVHCKDDYISWKEEIEDWYERSQAEIQGSLGFSEMELFRTSGGSRFVLSVQPFDGRHQQDLQFFHNRLYSLRMIIGDMNMRLR